jgi:glycosyltransferase involved in cell wall biosynthesis
MKIAFLSDWMRRGAGVSVATVNLADALATAGHEVTLCGPRAIDAEAVLERSAAFACAPLPPLGRHPVARAHAVLALRRRIERTRADVYVPVTFPFERLIGWIDGPTVLYDHGSIPAAGAPLPLAVALLYVQASTRSARARATGVITISRWLAQQVRRARRAGAIAVVPNGIDHIRTLTSQPPQAASARRWLGLPPSGCVVLTVGRCGPDARYKNVHGLAHALARRGFFARGGTLAAVGPAGDTDRRWLSRRGVTPLGMVDSAGLAAAYAAADVHVSASRWEGFNLPLLEAQYLGVPVLALDSCAHPEVVHQRAALVPDLEALADAVMGFQRPSELERTAAAVFAQSFVWRRAAERFTTVLEQMTS